MNLDHFGPIRLEIIGMLKKYLTIACLVLVPVVAVAATFTLHTNKSEKAVITGGELIGIEDDDAAYAVKWITPASLKTYILADGVTLSATSPISYASATGVLSMITNAYQAYDANMIAWPSAISATEVGRINGVTGDISTNGGFPVIIASGAEALSDTTVAANTCNAAEEATATGVVGTDIIIANPNAQLNTIDGYGVTSAGALRVDVYPTADKVNFVLCNPTGTEINQGALTINWKVIR